MEKLNKEDLINLFSAYLSVLPSRWERANNYINFYLTLVTSVVGATIAGLGIFNDFPKVLILIIGPVIAFIFCFFAKKTIKKQDAHIREWIAMLARFLFELGLHENLRFHEPSDGKVLWPNDKSFMLPRWVESRINAGNSSEDFIKNFTGGSRKYAFHIFTCFQVISILLAIIIALIPFM